MAWAIQWTRSAEKELRAFDRSMQRRIVEVLERGAEEPFASFKKLKGSNMHRLRVGRYRAILLLQVTKTTIVVVKVGHRGSVYR